MFKRKKKEENKPKWRSWKKKKAKYKMVSFAHQLTKPNFCFYWVGFNGAFGS